MELTVEMIRAKFKPVFREISFLEWKIDKKEGFIFTKHTYTQAELLESEHFDKIDSFTEKIGDDIRNWYNSGKLSENEQNIYYLQRAEVDDALERLRFKIETREPTWWEKVGGVVKQTFKTIMDNMPEKLKREYLPFLNKIYRKTKKVFRQLTYKKTHNKSK